jgi:hypothetical protein
MDRTRIVAGFGLWLGLLYLASPAGAQQKCPLPPALTASPAPNIFTPQQEVDLGDVEAERIEHTVPVIQDDVLAAYLNKIAKRIVDQLPPTQLKIRVILIDLPIVNAFSLPGGRIYVTRKMVAFARSDDELAALLSHEMGHILSHQGGIDMTRQLHDVIGVTSVGDRKDIAEKMNRLMDNAARNIKVFQKTDSEEEPHQYQADQLALYALADAGYAPGTFSDFFDRLAQTKGKTGSWISDLFVAPTTNEKRLREIRKSIEGLPAVCRQQASSPPTPEFLAWQTDVIAYAGLGRKDILTGLTDKKVLDPPLRSDISSLKFSPDGKFVLAQDDSSIFVLSREPLRLLFRIDAEDSRPAQFTPDSQSVVFDTRKMRVEEWRIADQERTAVHEMTIPKGCDAARISPDGKTFACMRHTLDLELYDVATGNLVFSKKCSYAEDLPGFVLLNEILFAATTGEEFEPVHMAFSQDSRTLLVANLIEPVAVDLTTHQQISLHGDLAHNLRAGFAFLDPNRVAAANIYDLKKGVIMEFPSGKVLKQLTIGGARLEAPAHGDYLLERPVKDGRVGLLDFETQTFPLVMKKSPAVDVYDKVFVGQKVDGRIALMQLPDFKVLADAPLSFSPLGRLRAEAVSPDLRWVAVSGETRGAVWNAWNGKRVFFTRGFRGAYFDGNEALLADFPKLDPVGRTIARMDLATLGSKETLPIDDKAAAWQWGQFLITRKPAGKGGSLDRNTILDVSDVRDGHSLWTRTFPKEMPELSFSRHEGTLLFSWQVDEDSAKDEIKNSPALQARLAAIHDRKTTYLIEVADAKTGTPIGSLLIDTGKGSFRVEGAYSAGDWVVITDSHARTLVYSLKTGEQKAALPGDRSTLSQPAGLYIVQNEVGKLDIYNLGTFDRRSQLVFSSPISTFDFGRDGTRLLVLTKGQTLYTFDTSRIGIDDGPKEAALDSAK